MEDEDFGYCESCGVEIGIRRLEARPTADLCIDCKTLAEIREKTDGWLITAVPSRLPQAGNAPALFLFKEMTDTHYIGRFAPLLPASFILVL